MTAAVELVALLGFDLTCLLLIKVDTRRPPLRHRDDLQCIFWLGSIGVNINLVMSGGSGSSSAH